MDGELESLPFIIDGVTVLDGEPVTVLIPPESLNGIVELQIVLPQDYPDSASPYVSPNFSPGVSKELRGYVQRHIQQVVSEHLLGTEHVYTIFSSVQDALSTYDADNTRVEPDTEVNRPVEPDTELKMSVTPPTVVNKSKFIGFACRVTSEEEFAMFRDRLVNDPHHVDVTHHIAAFVLGDEKSSLYDDDGEKGAAQGMLKLLLDMGKSNMAVIVARWYGGKKLGPLRFRVINAVAKEAIEAWG